MAKTNLLAEVAKKPLGVQLGILGAIVLVLVGLYYFLLFSGLQEERAGAVGRKKSISKKLEELRADARALESLRRERAERKLKIEKGLLKLPAKSELPAFLKQLQNQAGAAGVKLKSYSQQNEENVDAFIKVPYKVEATGTFYQVARYFWLLWEYSKSDSGLIITIENLDLGRAQIATDGLVLTASFTASTFRQADVAEPPPAPEPAKGKGGKAADGKPGSNAVTPQSQKDKVDAASAKQSGKLDSAAGGNPPGAATPATPGKGH